MTDKTEVSRQNVVLPRVEWEAFMDDVRKLIRADEELSDAHNRILSAYDQLQNSYEQLLRERPKASRVRGLFRRKQTQQIQETQIAARSCTYCHATLEPRDRFCPTCGRTTERPQGTFPSVRALRAR